MRISFPTFPGVRVSGGVGKPKGCMVFLRCVVLLGTALRHWHGLLQIIMGLVVLGFLIYATRPRAKQPRERGKHRA